MERLFGTSPVIQLGILQEIPMSSNEEPVLQAAVQKAEAGHRRVTQGFRHVCHVSAAQRNHGETETPAF